MPSLLAFLFGACAVVNQVTASPHRFPLQRREEYAIQSWANERASYDFQPMDNGRFTVDWDEPPGGNFVVGLGWMPGSDKKVNYSGTFETPDWAYLALYGWTDSPMVEYYVIESMGVHNPSDNISATFYGTVQSDGGTYEIWQKQRLLDFVIDGKNYFDQFWSIRTKKRVGGTITTGNHFRAWEAAGLQLGKQSRMYIAIEGQTGAGKADITVGKLPTTPVKETPTDTYRSVQTGYPTPVKKPPTTPRPVTATPTPAPGSGGGGDGGGDGEDGGEN